MEVNAIGNDNICSLEKEAKLNAFNDRGSESASFVMFFPSNFLTSINESFGRDDSLMGCFICIGNFDDEGLLVEDIVVDLLGHEQ